MEGRSQNLSPSTQTHSAHPSQEWRGTSGARTQTHTNPNTPARSGGPQLESEPKHTHPHRTPRPGVAGYKRSAHTGTHTPEHPSQEWRGVAPTRAKAHPSTPHTSARSGGIQAEHAHNHASPKIPASNGGVQAKPKRNRTHHRPQLAMEGRSQNLRPSTPTEDPSQDWRGYRETQTQAQAPLNSRKPGVHSQGTEAARAIHVTRPNKIRSPGVRLHPKACAALGLEAERVTPKHLGTPVASTCMHALGTGYARKSDEPLGFRPNEGTCASTENPRVLRGCTGQKKKARGHTLQSRQERHGGGDQPSWCCPVPFCWGPPVRSSGM